MPQKADIQAQIDEIQAGANYTANQMRPTLTNMLDYASAGQTPVFTGLVANGTTASTTLVLNVGVNIIETATTTNYACKLPQPVTGQRVTVVNISQMAILVFPSNIGGQINNLPVDQPLAIPADRRTYDFICIENPLPGAWTVSPPAIAQYDSGEISLTTVYNNSTIAFASFNGIIFASEKQGSNLATTGFAYNSLNRFNIVASTPQAYPDTNYSASYKPPSPWNTITAVKVYTNILPGLGVEPSIGFGFGSAVNKYQAGTTNFITAGDLAAGSIITKYLTSTVNDVPPSISPSLSTNVGDAGTSFLVSSINPNSYTDSLYPNVVGDLFISSDGVEDTWFSRTLFLSFRPFIIGAVKFRVFIEYN